jgi:hypothetical protein
LLEGKKHEKKERTKKVNNGFLFLDVFTQYRFSNNKNKTNNNNDDNMCNGIRRFFVLYMCARKKKEGTKNGSPHSKKKGVKKLHAK